MNASTFTPYVYEPLSHPGQSRLLTLEPGSHSDKIRCSLTICGAGVGEWLLAEGYEALSYAWGDGGRKMVISVDDAQLKVTENLYMALRRLRHQSRMLTLWVDAICIDQENPIERSAQVRLMYDIYSDATRVVVWLGEEEDDSKIAMAILKQGDADEQWRNGIGTVDYFNSLRALKYAKSLCGVEDLAIESREFIALEKLFVRSWWSRMWVLQEIVAAKDIVFICGGSNASWRDLYRGMLDVHDGHYEKSGNKLVPYSLLGVGGRSGPNARLRSMSEKVDALAFARMRSQHQGTLDVFLCKLGWRQVSDPRDKIYSILNILEDDLGIVPDYNKSIRDLYLDVVRSWIRRHRNLDILLCRPTGPASLTGLASWTPDWTREFYPASEFQNVTMADHSQRMVSEKTWNCVGEKRETLLLQGDLIGEVCDLNNMIPARCYDTDEWEQGVYSWESWNIRSSRQEIMRVSAPNTASRGLERSESLKYLRSLEPHWRTLLFGQGKSSVERNTYNFEYLWWARSRDGGDLPHFADDPLAKLFNGQLIDCASFMALLRASTIGRRLCTLRNGKAALVPNETREGDLICLLKGSHVPFVLRALPKGSFGASDSLYMRLCSIIGPAYVHGAMESREQEHGNSRNDVTSFMIV